jgi:hypothetical protein
VLSTIVQNAINTPSAALLVDRIRPKTLLIETMGDDTLPSTFMFIETALGGGEQIDLVQTHGARVLRQPCGCFAER